MAMTDRQHNGLHRWGGLLCLALLFALGGHAPSSLAAQSSPVSQLEMAGPDAALPLTDAQAAMIYDYAYPLVLMRISQDLMFTVPFRPPGQPNQFIHFKQLAQPQNRAVVLGNRNTLYSVGWVDLSEGPVRFEIPDMLDRYYVMPLLDAWTNTFVSLGSRTTGQQAQKYLLVSASQPMPDAPPGYEIIVCPTDMVWITGRIQADSQQDAVAAGLLQDAYVLTPNAAAESANGEMAANQYVPRYQAAQVRKPVPYSLQMTAGDYYNEFFQQWLSNPSPAQDSQMLALLAAAGIKPGANRFEDLPVAVQQRLDAALQTKQQEYLAAFYQGTAQRESWTFNREQMGVWGTDYERRAYWAMWGLGANLVEDAVYGVTQLDTQLQPLRGESVYRLRFPAGQTPPTSAFWSVTAYDIEGYLEANDQHRYSLGSHHDLQYNADGSLDLHLSARRPANETVNWVPTPTAEFKVLLRIYWPGAEVLDGTWQIPALEAVVP